MSEVKARADARRNRQVILKTARSLFAEHGLGVSVQEVARQSGVSTGTVSRHFATKEDLFEAILSRQMDDLVALSLTRRAHDEPGDAFFAVFDAVIAAGAADKGLAQRLSAVVDAKAGQLLGPSVQALCDQLEETLIGAQESGEVRKDLSLADVEALMAACMSRPEAAVAMASVVRCGLLTTSQL